MGADDGFTLDLSQDVFVPDDWTAGDEIEGDKVEQAGPGAEPAVVGPDPDPDADADLDAMDDERRHLYAFENHPELDYAQQHARMDRVRAWELAHRTQTVAAPTPEREPVEVFADVAAILDGELAAVAPDAGPGRTDGARLLYAGKVNALFGDPEAAKTLLSLVVLADSLIGGGHAAFLDTDHNGGAFVLRLLLALGVPRDALIDRMHYAEPEDRDELLRAVEAVIELPACPVVLDSIGENLGLWGVGPNDDQGFLDLNRHTAARIAKAGHTVVTIDHMAKNTDSRKFGATGTTAKLRAADGAVYEVAVVAEFSPTTGGRSALMLRKDRSGGVRALGHKRGETVAVFELTAPDAKSGGQTWTLTPGTAAPSPAIAAAAAVLADVASLNALTPPPSSKADVMQRMSWGTTRALDALRAWRAQAAIPQQGSRP